MRFPFRNPDKTFNGLTTSNGAYLSASPPNNVNASVIIRSSNSSASNYATVTVSAGYLGEAGNNVEIQFSSNRLRVYASGEEIVNKGSTQVNNLSRIRTALQELSEANDGIDFTVTITGRGNNSVAAGRYQLEGGRNATPRLAIIGTMHNSNMGFLINKSSAPVRAATPARHVRCGTGGDILMFSLAEDEYLHIRGVDPDGAATASSNNQVSQFTVEEYWLTSDLLYGQQIFRDWWPQGCSIAG